MSFRNAICVLAFFLAIRLYAIEADSITTMQKNGQTVILYEVGPKETIYSIARKYNIPPKAIIAINPEVQNSGLKTGQKIFVPFETARANKPQASQNTADEIEGATYHMVESGQTLYSVSKIYKVSVDELKRWNNLGNSPIKTGMKLIVKMPDESAISQTSVSDNSDVSKKTVRSNTGYDKIVEKGLADVFDTAEGTEFHYALHKNLPTGTVVKVINEATGISVYARVIGRLPATTDKNIVIKLSKLAFDKLSPDGRSFKVQTEYLP